MSDQAATWMRSVGAVEASWHPDGTIASLKLGAAPVAVSEDEADDVPVKRKSAEARVIELRNERRRIALGASGGPVRRVSED